jgi:hypothetical protein
LHKGTPKARAQIVQRAIDGGFCLVVAGKIAV